MDSYKYLTLHAEYRLVTDHNSNLNFYYGGYIRLIHKRILTEGYTSGPYGLFSKQSRNFIGNGISIGETSGYEWTINNKWLIDFNAMIGAGKYVTQADYVGHDKILLFFDTRIALQVGFRF